MDGVGQNSQIADVFASPIMRRNENFLFKLFK
jgi:hypothetical protein